MLMTAPDTSPLPRTCPHWGHLSTQSWEPQVPLFTGTTTEKEAGVGSADPRDTVVLWGPSHRHTPVPGALMGCLLSLPRDRLIEQLYREIGALKEELESFKAEVGDSPSVARAACWLRTPGTRLGDCGGPGAAPAAKGPVGQCEVTAVSLQYGVTRT